MSEEKSVNYIVGQLQAVRSWFQDSPNLPLRKEGMVQIVNETIQCLLDTKVEVERLREALEKREALLDKDSETEAYAFKMQKENERLRKALEYGELLHYAEIRYGLGENADSGNRQVARDYLSDLRAKHIEALQSKVTEK